MTNKGYMTSWKITTKNILGSIFVVRVSSVQLAVSLCTIVFCLGVKRHAVSHVLVVMKQSSGDTYLSWQTHKKVSDLSFINKRSG